MGEPAPLGSSAPRTRGSENLGVIHAQGDVLVLQRLRWLDEVRAAGDAAPREDVSLSDEEISAALEYIDATGDFDMQQMHDEYAAAVNAMVKAKAEEHAPSRAAEPAEREEGAPLDLMAALQAAADKARADRDEDADVHHMDDRKPTGKKKAPAKKTAAKKAATKKTATKRGGGRRAG